jgi:WD40 repeat protein
MHLRWPVIKHLPSRVLPARAQVRSGAFTADGTELLTSGSDGTVYVWDLRMQRCSQRYVDEGCLNGTALACSANGSMFATGAAERAELWITAALVRGLGVLGWEVSQGEWGPCQVNGRACVAGEGAKVCWFVHVCCVRSGAVFPQRPCHSNLLPS